MPTPGAQMSTQLPKLLHDASASLLSVAATVSTPLVVPAAAGEWPHASAPSLPAATAKNTPLATAVRTAWSTAAFCGPPRLMFVTAGRLPGPTPYPFTTLEHGPMRHVTESA